MGNSLARKLPYTGRDPFQDIFINEKVIPFFAKKKKKAIEFLMPSVLTNAAPLLTNTN